VLDLLNRYDTDGYATIQPVLRPSYHTDISARLDRLVCGGNNLLPEIPPLSLLFRDANVKSALNTILGEDYLLEPHRYAHTVQPGWWGMELHNDEFAGRPWTIRPPNMNLVMVLYYPQAVTEEDGPTVVVPGSHHRIHEWPDKGQWPASPYDCTPLLLPCGAVVIANMCLIHGSLQNKSTRPRRMVKFLCSDMRENPDGITVGLIRNLDDPDPNSRAAAALDMARHAHRLGRPHFNALVKALDDPDRYVRAYAVEALLRSGDPAAQGVLLDWLMPRRWERADHP
jgi:hypothetical protein